MALWTICDHLTNHINKYLLSNCESTNVTKVTGEEETLAKQLNVRNEPPVDRSCTALKKKNKVYDDNTPHLSRGSVVPAVTCTGSDTSDRTVHVSCDHWSMLGVQQTEQPRKKKVLPSVISGLVSLR